MKDEGTKEYIRRDQGCICNSLRSCATDQVRLRALLEKTGLIEGIAE